jgi:phosphatidylserine/phosphatidylglycerophosphate/cardiolipin synthase-like enzyme
MSTGGRTILGPISKRGNRYLRMLFARRAVLHAKCIVIDGEAAFVTSANPTTAAYTKNIELGVVIRGGTIPGQIASHFSSLIQTGALRRLDLSSR